ncbi:peptidoglycan DD-metalloendopeptidase family protein [Alphaproteobacteria bacterium]|nr:peptidoglycan DD-metalloendopeptidase family protein [Alphaproteobacteria bacterium]
MRLRRFELIIGALCFVGGISLIVYDFFQNKKESEEPEKISVVIQRDFPSVLEIIEAKKKLLSSSHTSTTTEAVVTKSESFVPFLRRHGLSTAKAQSVQKALRPYYKDKFLRRGQRFYIKKDKKENDVAHLNKIIFLLPPGKKISLITKEGSVVIEKKPDILPKKLQYTQGIIQNSLYIDGLKSGLSKSVINNLSQQFSYSLDLQRSLRRGDTFEVIVERFYDIETGFIDPGSAVYAALNTKSGIDKIYRYATSTTQAEYFDEKGHGVRKALLKTPVRGARISSRFGMRHHPVQGYTKMHRGIDFAAPKGTPILAAGNGYIKKRGYLGSYGNYILIQHNKDYASAYAHLSRFAKGQSKGCRVKQGQVIGYIGSTGCATGAHLHYEVHYKRKQVNPHKIKMPSQRSLVGTQRQDFLTHLKSIHAQLRSLKDLN